MAIMSMIILTSLASVSISLSSNGLSRLTGFGYGDNVKAKSAAEAGIRYVWMNAVQNTDPTTYVWDTSKLISDDEIALDSSDDNSPTFSVDIAKIDTNLPDGIKETDSYYKVTSIGRAGHSKSVTEAYLLLSPAVSLTQLVKDGDVSNSTDWIVDEEKGTATAPGDANFYQILFNMDDDFAKKGITYHYKINLIKTTEGHATATGYGIYYLADGNPNDMSGYVLQYDPGLTPDQILVKKVEAGKTNHENPWENEIKVRDQGSSAPKVTAYNSYGGEDKNYFNESWQDTDIAATWDSSIKTWNNTGDLIKNETTKKPAVDSFIKLNNTDISKDIMSVPMDVVMKQLNKIKANNTSANSMLGQDHILTIDVQPTTVSGHTTYVHHIYIDGLEILRFIDRSTDGTNYALDPGHGRTGLRVWNSTAQFSNLGDIASTTKIRSWEIQKP